MEALVSLQTSVREAIANIELEVRPGEYLSMSASIGRAWSADLAGGYSRLFKTADLDMFEDKRRNPHRQPRGARPKTALREETLFLMASRSLKSLSTLNTLSTCPRR